MTSSLSHNTLIKPTHVLQRICCWTRSSSATKFPFTPLPFYADDSSALNLHFSPPGGGGARLLVGYSPSGAVILVRLIKGILVANFHYLLDGGVLGELSRPAAPRRSCENLPTVSGWGRRKTASLDLQTCKPRAR